MKAKLLILIATLKPILTSIGLFFKEFYLRLKAQSPAYMIKVRTGCITLSGIGGSLTASGVNFTIWGLDIPKLVTILGVIASVIASLSVKDVAAINQQVQN